MTRRTTGLNVPIPFVPNTADDTHCMQASLQMLVQWFLPGRHTPDDEVERESGYRPGHGSWDLAGITWLAHLGLDVDVLIDADYARFAEGGVDYLRERFGEEMAEYEAAHGDIPLEQSRVPAFLAAVRHHMRPPTIDDLKTCLHEDGLPLCKVNSARLNDRPGYSGHYVVIRGYDGAGLFLNDPGLPAAENRHVDYGTFEAAWAYAGEQQKVAYLVRLLTSGS